MIRCLKEFLLQSWKCWHNSVLWFLLLLLTEIYHEMYLFLSLATHLFFIQITHKYQYLIKWDAFPSPKKFLQIVFARLWCIWVPVGQFGLPCFDQLILVVLVLFEKTENELKKHQPQLTGVWAFLYVPPVTVSLVFLLQIAVEYWIFYQGTWFT